MCEYNQIEDKLKNSGYRLGGKPGKLLEIESPEFFVGKIESSLDSSGIEP